MQEILRVIDEQELNRVFQAWVSEFKKSAKAMETT
jgi:hypothetical protein